MKTIHCNIFFRLLFAQIIGAFLYTALFSGNPVSVLLDGDPKPPGIIGIRFSNDGKYFATCAENGLFDIWDFETGALRCAFNLHVKDSMEGWRRTNQTLVKSFFFDWTGQYLYVLSADNGLFLKVKLQRHIICDTLARNVSTANISPGHTYFALGMQNGKIIVYEAKSETKRYQLNPEHLKPSTTLAFNRGETKIAYSNEKGKLIIQGLDGKIYSRLTDKNSRKMIWSSVLFNANDKNLVTLSSIGTVYVWDIFNDKLKISKEFAAKAIAPTPDSYAILVANSRGLERVELESLSPIKTFEVSDHGSVLCLDVNQHGDFFISGGEYGTTRIWNENYSGALLSYHLFIDHRSYRGGPKRIVVNSNRLYLPTDPDSKQHFQRVLYIEKSDPDIVQMALAETLQKRQIAQKEDQISRQGKDYALFFAVKDYGGRWPALKNPISDAEALAEILKEQYGFEVDIMRNPIRDSIYARLEQYRDLYLDSLSQLFIFFSGHGYYVDATTEGFFIPADGRSVNKDPFQDSYLPHARLEKMLNAIRCPHILVAIDACYSGTFDQEIAALRGDDPEDDIRPGEQKSARRRFVERELRGKSRLYLTSGGKERTSDGVNHSPFVEKFLEALNTKGGTNKILTVAELYSYLESTNPKARKGRFGSSAPEGNFLFIAK